MVYRVSIPVRVLGVLEREVPMLGNCITDGFNPCKGFGGFGTAFESGTLAKIKGFNPCKGFGGFGTKDTIAPISSNSVSIPVRVLRVLEL